MGTITLSVPDELKEKMSKTDWINWSSVARHAFSEILKDMEELQLKKKLREISEIAEDDNREVKENVFKEFVESAERVSEELKSGNRKAMTLGELDKLMRHSESQKFRQSQQLLMCCKALWRLYPQNSLNHLDIHLFLMRSTRFQMPLCLCRSLKRH